ncbi:MAG: hypothetical protein AAGJ10_04320 [Bacteroidota bacterium]
MRKTWDAIKATLAQFLLIVFSVVLGLYLSDRIEERKKAQEASALLSVIEAEVAENMSLFDYWAPYHQRVWLKLDSLSRDAAFVEQFVNERTILFPTLLAERGTLMGRTPTSDAWDIAKSHPLTVNIDYHKLIALSRVYNQQASTLEPMFDMFDLYNSSSVNAEVEAAANLKLMAERLRELVKREEQLMYYFAHADTTLGLQRYR